MTSPQFEFGTLDVVPLKNGKFRYECKDATGNVIASRVSALKYVAATSFFISYRGHWKVDRNDMHQLIIDPHDPWLEFAEYADQFYGRLDLVGKGNSWYYFELMKNPTETKRIARAMLFELPKQPKSEEHIY